MLKRIIVMIVTTIFCQAFVQAGLAQKEKGLLRIAPEIHIGKIYAQLDNCYVAGGGLSSPAVCKAIFNGIKQVCDVNYRYFIQTYAHSIKNKVSALNASRQLSAAQKEYKFYSFVLSTIKKAFQNATTKATHYKKNNCLPLLNYHDHKYPLTEYMDIEIEDEEQYLTEEAEDKKNCEEM